MSTEVSSPKSRVVTLVLCLLLGPCGAHRLYLGRFRTAAAQFVTLGGLGVWWLIDVYRVLFGRVYD